MSTDDACESPSARLTGPDRATAGGITHTTLPALSFRSTASPSSDGVSPVTFSGNNHDGPACAECSVSVSSRPVAVAVSVTSVCGRMPG